MGFFKKFAASAFEKSQALEKWSQSSLHCNAQEFVRYLDQGGSPKDFEGCIPPYLDYSSNYDNLRDPNVTNNLLKTQRTRKKSLRS